MAETGWIIAGAGSNVSVTGGTAWTNPGNITDADDSTYAVASAVGKGSWSHYLHATDFDFDIPENATIVGVAVRIRKSDDTTNNGRDRTVQLIVGDSRVGSNYADTTSTWPGGTTDIEDYDYGGPDDLWGLELTVADVMASDFGVAFSATNNSTSVPASMRVQDIWMNIYYEPPTSPSSFMLFF